MTVLWLFIRGHPLKIGLQTREPFIHEQLARAVTLSGLVLYANYNPHNSQQPVYKSVKLRAFIEVNLCDFSWPPWKGLWTIICATC